MGTTTKQREDFTRAVMSAAGRVTDLALKYEARQLVAAWGALESGWGQTKQALQGFNIWNLTAGSSWVGPTMDGRDTEFKPGSDDGRVIIQKWRVYASLDVALTDVMKLLSKSRFTNYREAYAMLRAGEKEFVRALGLFDRVPDGRIILVDDRTNVGSYYTLPRSEYQKSFESVLLMVENIATRLKLDVSC